MALQEHLTSEIRIESNETNPIELHKGSLDVYKFINKNETNKLPWYFTLCPNKNKQQRWKTQCTSNFRKHLKSAHLDLYWESKDQNQQTLNHYFTGTSSLKKRKQLNLPSQIISFMIGN